MASPFTALSRSGSILTARPGRCALAAGEPKVAARIRIDEGVAEELPEADGSVDLIWCRDVLVHVEDLNTVFREFRRVLRPGGHAVIYQMTATDWLTAAEADRLWPVLGVYPASTNPQHFEAAPASEQTRATPAGHESVTSNTHKPHCADRPTSTTPRILK
jgi:SAM-dependent methyltransferase